MEEAKPRQKKKFGPYIVGKTLGTGTFGKVKLGIHPETGLKVAIKKIPYGNNTLTRKENAFREAAVMKLLNHPHIVRLYDVIDRPEKHQLCLILEYVEGGELFDYIVGRGRLKEDEARRFFCQIISALEYCHQNLIIHRDLKPENLLLDGQKRIKINDFGLSKPIDSEGGKNLYRLQTNCGSPLYTSPEIIKGQSYIGPEVDVWAIGVVLYAMVTGCQPWEGGTQHEQVANAAKGKFGFPPYISADLKDLITKMLTVDLKKRCTVQEIREHPWAKPGFAKYPPPPQPDRKKFHKIEDVDMDIVLQLQSVGFSKEEILQGLLTNNNRLPVYFLYFLCEDLKKKEMQRALEQVKDIEPPPPPVVQPTKPAPTPKPSVPEIVAPPDSRRNTVVGPTPDIKYDLVVAEKKEKRRGSANVPDEPAPPPPTTSKGASPQPVTHSDKKNSKGFLSIFNRKRADSTGVRKDSGIRNSADANKPSVASKNTTPAKSKKVLKNASGTFSAHTTSTKPAEVIASEIERVLKQMKLDYKEKKREYRYKAVDEDSGVEIELEICSVDKGNLIRGVRFKRLAGDLWTYKEICDEICNLMKL